ncbi:MAG: alpha/beta hydrolase, partial [Candidatus Thorarchaeota archaeon]|nr:alpha/beta hydrolase [Candidatus Thorarchaeota archaeon]
DDLSTISCPSLLFHGKNDRMVPFSDMKRIFMHLGGSVESFDVESEGHFYLNSLSLVVDKVLTFVHNVWDADLQDN